MKQPWKESSGIVPWLILFACILAIAVLLKDKVITKSFVIGNKDVFDAISKITTTLFLIIGAILSYLRFFKGRTFRPKLIIKPISGVISFEKDMLHWVEIEIQNTGSVSVWNYDLKVHAFHHGRYSYCKNVTEFVLALPDLGLQERLIDVGESAFEHLHIVIPNQVIAVTYFITVIDQNETTWTRCLTVKNSLPK